MFFEDKDNNGCITTEADTSGLAVEVLQRLWYYPFGLQMENLSTWETAPGQAYRYNGKERDTLSGWTDFGARWGILEIGRWNGVDPLAGEFPGWSPFSSMLNNPISFVDPDGKAPTSPIFDPNGNFLGVDSKGYTGEIIIMSAKAYNIVTGYGNNTLDHGSVAGLIEDGHAFKLNDAGLNAKGFSKVYTHVTKQLKGVNFSRLEGGIVNIIDTPIDEDGNMGHANGDSFGKWTNLPINAEAGTIINSDNTINVTTRLLGGTGQFTTVEYTQSVLGIHEYKGHGLNKIPEAFPAHERAYKLQFNHKGTFDKLTPFQQKSIKIKAGIK
jgi:RHS repeat-associated protein